MTKIDESLRIIEAGFRHYQNPCVLSSFGKDSMVLLWLLKQYGRMPRVLFMRVPFLQKKYAFAYRIAQEWDLDLYDSHPARTLVQQNGEHLSVICQYVIGGTQLDLPVDFYAPKKHERVICGLSEVYHRPLGGSNFATDLMFVGHKSSDEDELYGKIPLKAEVAHNANSASLLYPLKDWTDEDIWDAAQKYEIPMDYDRYEKYPDGWDEKEDMTLNSDYLPGCTACMVKNGGPVHCPKMGLTVSNCSKQLNWKEQVALPYMEFN